MKAVAKHLREHGLYTMIANNGIHTNPPLCITEEQLDGPRDPRRGPTSPTRPSASRPARPRRHGAGSGGRASANDLTIGCGRPAPAPPSPSFLVARWAPPSGRAGRGPVTMAAIRTITARMGHAARGERARGHGLHRHRVASCARWVGTEPESMRGWPAGAVCVDLTVAPAGPAGRAVRGPGRRTACDSPRRWSVVVPASNRRRHHAVRPSATEVLSGRATTRARAHRAPSPQLNTLGCGDP
jgi:hypothetical protein